MVADRYEVQGELGRGSAAVVLEAVDLCLARPVALKALGGDIAGDADVRDRFERDARTAAQVPHHNLVPIYDVVLEEDLPVVVQEQLPGATLSDAMRHGPVPATAVMSVALDVLAGLDAAHAAGLVHGDIRPQRVFLCDDGIAKLSTVSATTSLWAEIGSVAANPGPATDPAADGMDGPLDAEAWAHLPPEQLDGEPIGPESDIWSLGALMQDAVTAGRPAPSPPRRRRAGRAPTDEPGTGMYAGASEGFAAVVSRATHPDPTARYASAADMAAAIAAVASVRIGGARNRG